MPARPDQRQADQLREISFFTDIAPHATASVLIGFGNTRVICAATIQDEVPMWMKAPEPAGRLDHRGVQHAPVLHARAQPREAAKPSGRTMEIQRLIGRSLRSAGGPGAAGAR
jgi:ribonuclease PH